MRVLVDTSVWVDFFNGHDSEPALLLSELIADEVDIATCGVILAEFFQGIHDLDALAELETYFREMTYLAPNDPSTYFSAADLFRTLRRRGVTVRSTIDCLIVQLAQEGSTRLLAKDRDMTLILDSGLVGVRGVT